MSYGIYLDIVYNKKIAARRATVPVPCGNESGASDSAQGARCGAGGSTGNKQIVPPHQIHYLIRRGRKDSAAQGETGFEGGPPRGHKKIMTTSATIRRKAVFMLGAATMLTAMLASAPVVAQKANTAATPPAAGGSGLPDGGRHPEIEKFKREGGEVEYIGHAYGLDGWLLTRKDIAPRTAYTTDRGGLVIGSLVDPDGQVVTMTQLQALKAKMEGSQAAQPGAEDPRSGASKAEHFYATLEKRSAWVQSGPDDAPYLYMLMNVNCDHCKAYWKELEPVVKQGKLQVRFVPYGAAPANREGGAAMMSSADPGAAWSEYIAGKPDALAKSKIVDGALSAIDANTRMVKEYKVGGPPFTMYRRLDDGKLMVIAGVPTNMMLLRSELTRN